ncbi:PIG-L family deacetylase [Kiritimatiellota bacterium B12222]|nr:PIG-L family deacetylase [Kiritimatiellota bacterium B12222]
MKLSQSTASFYVPDRVQEPQDLARITHLGIGAHQDDLEFMAYHGILAGYDSTEKWFGGITCTNGSGSPREGKFVTYSDKEMQAIRRIEQNRAADIGQYAAMIQLDYPSEIVNDPHASGPVSDLVEILKASRPEIIYTHHPMDQDPAHLGVMSTVIRAIRQLSPSEQPQQLIGCETWRGLDWMLDHEKIIMHVGGNPELAEKLNGVYVSQISGGIRYDLATTGRRLANAAILGSSQEENGDQVCFGIDLMPLTKADAPSMTDYIFGFIKRFAVHTKTHLQHIKS